MGYISVRAAAELLGVCVKTLHRWDTTKVLVPARRTAGGHRRYLEEDLSKSDQVAAPDEQPHKPVVAYARVSSSDQRADLVRQSEVLKRHLAERPVETKVELIEDIGSGMNFQKKGLRRVLVVSTAIAVANPLQGTFACHRGTDSIRDRGGTS